METKIISGYEGEYKIIKIRNEEEGIECSEEYKANNWMEVENYLHELGQGG